jgi:DNA mismatch repair protein MutS2
MVELSGNFSFEDYGFMDKASLEMLEFPRVLEILADYTSFPVSRERIMRLLPSSDPELVQIWLKQSAEARHLNSIRPNFAIGKISDVTEPVGVAAKGQSLMPPELLRIREMLSASRNVRNSLKLVSNEIPFLWKIVDGITDLAAVEKVIDKCININGEVVDSASARLQGIRAHLRSTRQRLMEKLESMLKSRNRTQVIQEAYITERNTRYVIPVKAEYKKDVQGIVHDVSNTGATIFIEPMETIEMGNDLRELVVEEKQEVERILTELSAEVGNYEQQIRFNQDILADLDVAMAKARYAESVKAVEPIINDGDSKSKTLLLSKARHPLLHGSAVPLSIEIGKDFDVLVITGPNAGGKTVALKTVGLLTLMAQAGLPIPVSEESHLPVFASIFADIGDQQSIEHTMSTFSWHITNIVRIMQESGNHSLVLLDELGISTDPEEGSALARAVLLELSARKTMVVATTHYNDLKVFAHTTPGMCNASMDFDPATFMPTFKMTLGIPGRSNAFTIAARMGLDASIIGKAKSMMGKTSDEVELLLNDLMKEKQHYEGLVQKAEDDRKEMMKLQSRLNADEIRLKDKENKLITDISDRLAGSAAELQRTIRETEAELRKSRRRETLDHARETVSRAQKKVEESLELLNREAVSSPPVNINDILPGDVVTMKNKKVKGEVVSVDSRNGRVEIKAGNSRITIRPEDIGEISKPEDHRQIKYSVLKKRRETLTGISSELDLRGKRADEVPYLLDRFLNDAFLASLNQVRIIHGYATGTVRNIVRDMLGKHDLVSSFEPGVKGEGGDGVTIAMIKK